MDISKVKQEDQTFGNESNQNNVVSLLDVSDTGESWVELSTSSTPERVTPLPPPLLPEEYMRLLREATRESNQSSNRSSTRVSIDGSRRVSPKGSPKSPPNSPNQDKPITGEEQWNSYFINCEKDPLECYYEKNMEWIWDWSSRPDQQPPKVWNFDTPKIKNFSFRYAKVGQSKLFSKKGLCTLLLTNVISLLLGAGIGLWLSKRGHFIPTSIYIQ